MTSKDRYHEIQDFCQFLDALYETYCKHVNAQVKIVLFGFSQGCATIWRWVHASKPRFDYLINWSGTIPEDITYNHLSTYLENKELFLRYGISDQFITEKVVKELGMLIKQNELKVDIASFEGGHRVLREELSALVKEKIEAG